MDFWGGVERLVRASNMWSASARRQIFHTLHFAEIRSVIGVDLTRIRTPRGAYDWKPPLPALSPTDATPFFVVSLVLISEQVWRR